MLERHGDWIVLACGAVCAAYVLAGLPAQPVLTPDSASYLTFQPIRTAAYPLILKALGSRGAEMVQPVLYAGAATVLGLVVRRSTRSLWPALALLAGLFGLRDLNVYHYQIMTESLFMSVETLFIAATLRFFQRPGWRTACAISAMAGIDAAIRPTGYAMLVVLALMAVAVRRRTPGAWNKVMMACLVPMLLLVGVERVYTAHVQGSQNATLAGRHLFAKAALLDVPEDAPGLGPLAAAAGRDYAPIRALIDQAPSADIRGVLSVTYEGCLQYSCAENLQKTLNITGPDAERSLMAAALSRISRDLPGFAGLVWRDYRALWTVYPQRYPGMMTGFAPFVAAHQPLPFTQEAPVLDPANQGGLLAPAFDGILRTIGGATGLMTVAALIATLRGRLPPPVASTGLFLALAVHASMIWIAGAAAGLPRFTISLWPMITASLVLGLWGLWGPRVRGAGCSE